MASLRPGCILFDTKFQFKDKELGEKLIVVLNEPKGKAPYLICRTTSKEKKYRMRKPIGCQKEGKYFFVEKGNSFPKDTWLLLDDIFPYKKGELLRKHFAEQIKLIDNLGYPFLKEIKECIQKSMDIRTDYLEMIVDTII